MSGSSPTQPPATGATGQLGLLPTPAFTAPTAGQTVLTVGAGEEFSTLSAAIAASSNGDLIEVQAGTYTNDFSVVNDRVTIEGVGGMVNLVATVTPPNDKAILVTNTDITIENVAFSGSTVPDALGGNGAGIRYQGGNMTLINDEFTDNQEGMLADPDPSGTITIDHSVFDNNGVSNPSLAGYGYTHNLYVNEVGQLTIENSVFEHANVGHEIKSRADNTTIENNLIEDTATGTASYAIDLPDGGNAVVENNTIEKGPDAQNNNVIHFGGEGIPYANSALTVSGNTFVNDRGASTAMLLNQTIYTVTVDGNTLDNFTAKQLGSGPADYTDNWNGTGTEFADSSSSSFAGSSNTQYFTDAAPHSVTLATAGAAVVGGSGLLTVADLAGHVTVVGGAGGIDFTEAKGVGGSEIITAAGAHDAISVGGQDVINSGGADLITTGGGNVSVAITGSAGVEAGAGSNGWAVSGAADINIIAGSGLGSDTVNVLGGAHATVTGAGSYLQLVNAGGTSDISFTQNGALLQASVVGGASSTNMYGSAMVMTTSGGSAGTDVTFGAGNVLMTSAGADTVQAGSGNETIIVSGAAQIFEGSGALSVYGRSDGAGATIHGAGGTTLLAGDTGNLHYVGGAVAGTVISNLSRDFIEGGAGHLTITGPGSDEQIAGGSGGITLSTTGGADAITTAAGATDSIAVVFGSTILSNGTDQIALGTGNFNVTVTGASTVQGSTGNSHYNFTGNDVLLSRGTDYVQVASGADLQMTATGPWDQISETGGTVRFTGAASGGAATATISGGSGQILYRPGQHPLTVSETAGGALIQLGAGAAVVTAAGSDTVQFGAGTATVGYGGAGRTFEFVSGHAASRTTIDQFAVGQDKLAFLGVSVTAEQTGSTGTTLTLSDGSTVLLAGVKSAPNVAGLNGPVPQTLTSSGQTIAGTATAQVMTDDAGGNTISGGSGGLTLTSAGAGDLVRTAAGAHDAITLLLGGTVQSAGNDTISASGNTTITATGNLVAVAGAGNTTLIGGSGSVNFTAGSGTALVTGGSGSDTVTFGAGHATVSASVGADIYAVTAGHAGGSDLIEGFRAGTDQIVLHGYTKPATETLAGSTLTLGLSDGTTIALAGVTHLASNSIVMS